MKLDIAIFKKVKLTVPKFFSVVLFASCMLITLAVDAQPGDPGGGTKPGDVPITGIEILLAAGGALGIRKLLQGRKKNSI